MQPRQLRETLRQLLADTGAQAIADALQDPDMNIRLRALELAYKYGIGTQTGLVDADNESVAGVVALPALQLDAVQSDISPLRLLPAGPDEIGSDQSAGDTEPNAPAVAGNEAGAGTAGPGK